MRLAVSRGSMTCQRSTQVLRRGSDGPEQKLAATEGALVEARKQIEQEAGRRAPHRTAESRIVGTRDRGSGQGPGPRGTGRRARGEQEIATGACRRRIIILRRGRLSPRLACRRSATVPCVDQMTISVLTVSSLAGYSELLSLLASSYSASVARFLAPFSARPVL